MKKEIENYLYLEGLSLAIENISKENTELKKEIINLRKKNKITNILLSICIITTIASLTIGLISL